MTHALRWAATRAILMFNNCEGQSHKTVSTDQKLEEKGEPKRIRTEVPLLTSLTPYRQARPAHPTTENHFQGKMPILGRYGSGKGSYWPLRAANRLWGMPVLFLYRPDTGPPVPAPYSTGCPVPTRQFCNIYWVAFCHR